VTAPRIKWISRDDPPESFPPIRSALSTPNGLLAAGGDLAPERLVYAYRQGIFPWFENGQPILWWSPDPRCVLRPDEFHVARRFHRQLRKCNFTVSWNRAFDDVVEACAARRRSGPDTWITPAMMQAYSVLHLQGWAHSVEVWDEHVLAGGVYGLAIGRVFFGESMFSKSSNASKVALLALCRQLSMLRFELIDCQMPSPHLLGLGAELIARREFEVILLRACSPPTRFREWPESAVAANALPITDGPDPKA
jgi:leucyl/phenylalanyl-tRNA--protein transferase